MNNKVYDLIINDTCPLCGKKAQYIDSDQDYESYYCKHCDESIQIYFERKPTKMVTLDEDYEVEKELWSE